MKDIASVNNVNTDGSERCLISTPGFLLHVCAHMCTYIHMHVHHIYMHSKEVEEGTPSWVFLYPARQWLVALLHFWLVTFLPWDGGAFLSLRDFS